MMKYTSITRLNLAYEIAKEVNPKIIAVMGGHYEGVKKLQQQAVALLFNFGSIWSASAC